MFLDLETRSSAYHVYNNEFSFPFDGENAYICIGGDKANLPKKLDNCLVSKPSYLLQSVNTL